VCPRGLGPAGQINAMDNRENRAEIFSNTLENATLQVMGKVMSYRIGGWMVAAGISGALMVGAGPGVAWADPSGSTGGSSSSGASSSPAKSAPGASEASSSSTGTSTGRTGSTAAPAGAPSGKPTPRATLPAAGDSRDATKFRAAVPGGPKTPAVAPNPQPAASSPIDQSEPARRSEPEATPDTAPQLAQTELNAVVSQTSYQAPGTPAEPPGAPPAAWTLLAFARREFEAPAPTAVPADQELFTGQPSLVHEVVVAGLRVVDAVLETVGIPSITAIASAQVPIFTDGVPPFFLTYGLDVRRSDFEGMPVYTLQSPHSPSDEVIVGLHGGAYVGQISIFHWWTYADIARDTGAAVVVPVYPVAPKGTAGTVVPATADLLTELIEAHGQDNVSVLGDSAGGGLALAAAQVLVRRGAPTPGRMVLLAPWLDATVSDPASQTIPDPLLDVGTLQYAGRLWAGGLNPTDPLVSPINGSLRGLPPTFVYSGSLDLLSPQTLRLRERALSEGDKNFTFILRNGLIHDWDTFPFLPDAIADRPAIEGQLLGTDVLAPAVVG
jgi:triacylglycerol lipase